MLGIHYALNTYVQYWKVCIHCASPMSPRAQNEEDLTYMVGKLNEEFTKIKLEISIKRLNTWQLQRKEKQISKRKNVKIRGTEKFKYLGFILSKENTTDGEINSRLWQTRRGIT